jgi:hypothetical protein
MPAGLRHEIGARVPLWSTVRAHLPWGTVGAVPPVTCRSGNVLAGVQRPRKLLLINPCAVGSGVVIAKFHNTDGDWHIQVLPTGRSTARLLNRRNLIEAAGTLVVEVIPADQPSVPLPRLGTRVRVTGALVVDDEHGWRELHPAWQIVTLSP